MNSEREQPLKLTQTSFTARAVFVAAWLIAAAVLAAACGGSKSQAKAVATTPAASGTAQNGGRGFRGGTPPPAVLTSIAEGTPRAPFGGGTPPPAIQTAIAEGTPAASFQGGFGRGRVLPAVATLLGIDEAQLQTELDATRGATIASVAAVHGFGRESVRQALIDAQVQRLNDAVAAGRQTQADADAARSQFEANVDNLLDSNGGGPPGQPDPAP
jgi:hypothetical protein